MPAAARPAAGRRPLREERLWLLFERSPEAIVIADDEGRYLDANAAAVDLLGYPLEALTKMRVADLITTSGPPSGDRYRRYVDSGRESGEFAFVRPDGEHRVAEYAAFRIAPGLHASILKDVTARRREEAAAREEARASDGILASQKRILERIARGADLQDVLQLVTAMVEAERPGLPCSVHLLDEGGERLHPAASLGLREEFTDALDDVRIGSRSGSAGAAALLKEMVIVSDIAHDPRWADYREAAAAQGMQASWAAPALSRNDEVLGTVAFYTHEAREPQPSETELLQSAAYLVGIAVERHRELDRARHQAAKMREQADLIEAAHDAILVLDFKQRISFWNRGAEELYGWTTGEAMGKTAHMLLQTRFPGSLQDVLSYLDRHGHWRGMLTHRRRDGATVTVDSHWVLTRDESGKPLSVLEINRDITESKRAEEDRRRAQQEVAALNMRLQRAMAETHHRVKNNLQVVAAMIDMQLGEGVQTVAADEVRRLGIHVRTLAMIHDLLTQQAREHGEAHHMSSAEVLESLLPLLQSMAGNRPVSGRVEADVSLSMRQGTSLALIVNELVNNAVKHGKGRVDVAFDAQDGRARLIVADRGPGFAAGIDASAADTTGLMLVENLSRWDLGGHVSYGNLPEGGAQVTVEFPIVLPQIPSTGS